MGELPRNHRPSIGRHRKHACDTLGRMRKNVTQFIGKKAPDFTLTDHEGRQVRLSGLRGRNVVLAFFPLAWTPV